MAVRNPIPIPYLRECLSYDAETGVLRWRERPRSHFFDARIQACWNTVWARTTAGQIKANGYRQIAISINGQRRTIYAHQAAWALQTGDYPPFEIDHADGNRDNNRFFQNLRPATHAENAQNRSARGTSVEQKTGRFYARICADYRQYRLGTFDTEAEAHRAYLEAKQRLHPFQPIPR